MSLMPYVDVEKIYFRVSLHPFITAVVVRTVIWQSCFYSPETFLIQWDLESRLSCIQSLLHEGTSPFPIRKSGITLNVSLFTVKMY